MAAKLSQDINSPTGIEIAAYDADLDPSIRGIDITAAGVLVFVDVTDKTWTYDFSSLLTPQRLVFQIKKVVGDGAGAVGDGVTGTDIPLANLVGLS